MRLMLSRTHELLTQSLRDVHAAKLETMTLQFQQVSLQLQREKYRTEDLKTRLDVAQKLIVSQQNTIHSAMQDLVVLKGAGRVRQAPKEQEAEGVIEPDVDIVDQPSGVAEKTRLLREAENELAKILDGVDVKKVTPEALAAAIPASEEDWRREHAAPKGEASPVPVDLVAS